MAVGVGVDVGVAVGGGVDVWFGVGVSSGVKAGVSWRVDVRAVAAGEVGVGCTVDKARSGDDVGGALGASLDDGATIASVILADGSGNFVGVA